MENKIVNQHVELTAENVLSGRKAREVATRRGRETLFFDFERIRPRPGFNARIEYGDIEALAKSILSNGLESPLIVDVAEVDGEIVAYLNDGYRRHRAYQWLIDNGHDVKTVECFVNPKSITEEERLFKMFITQDNKALEPIEAADVFMRLVHLGHTPESVAKRIGKSLTYVKDYLKLAKGPEDIKMAVKTGVLSPSAAIVLSKKVKNENKRKEIIKEAASTGKKVKVKDVGVLEKGSQAYMLSQMSRFESHLMGFYPDWKQAEFRVLFGYFRGEVEEAELISLGNPKE